MLNVITKHFKKVKSCNAYYHYYHRTHMIRLNNFLFRVVSCSVLAAADVIPHGLPGNAKLFGDLSEGKVLIKMEVAALALLVREKLAVEIQQKAAFQSVVVHAQHLLSSFQP